MCQLPEHSASLQAEQDEHCRLDPSLQGNRNLSSFLQTTLNRMDRFDPCMTFLLAQYERPLGLFV